MKSEPTDNWEADIDATPLPSGKFAPILILVPPPEIGPPLRQQLEGEFDCPERAKLAALDAFAAMSRG